MIDSNVLLALAQISVALAGFSGIIVALRQRSLEHWPKHELVRFRYMLELAVYSIGFDLFPLLLDSLKFSQSEVWKITSMCLAIWLILRIIQTAQIKKNIRDRLNLNWFYVYQVGSGIMILVLVINAAELSPLDKKGLYYCGLGWLLFFSLSLFVRLSFAPISREKERS